MDRADLPAQPRFAQDHELRSNAIYRAPLKVPRAEEVETSHATEPSRA